MRVLLTGGSGFIAAHCVDILLQNKHSVVFTVRSDAKGEKILSNHPDVPKSQLSYVIVEDIAKEDAFDKAVQSDPPFEAVLHTASPFHFNVTDNKKDLLDPAIIGTTGILKAIKAHAPSVKHVAITSSFAAIINPDSHAEVYNDEIWNPVTMEQSLTGNAATAYRGSKKFAEIAAWDFVAQEKPNFQVTALCPPVVLGPVIHYFADLDSLNTSNQLVRDMVQGKKREGIPATPNPLWVDVRDVALAHVRAIEKPKAAGQRFLIAGGRMRNSEIADIIKKRFPELKGKLPDSYEALPKEMPFNYDASRSKEVLGLEYRGLEETVVDLVKSLQAAGA